MADTDLLVVSRGGVEYKITRGELDAYIKGGYTVVDSMLFNGIDAYLGRTPTVAGNRRTWTFSCWTKRGRLTGSQVMFSASNTDNSQFVDVTINGSNQLELDILDNNSTRTIRHTVAVFRDPSAWYHVVLAVDTTQATATDRIKLYVNNELLTTVAGTGTFPNLNAATQVNANTGSNAIGRRQGSADRYYDAYLSELNLIDGQALEPSAFGETGKFGEWLPKKYTGTYGTNGFYLEALDSADLGKDTSGNGNNWVNSTTVVQVIDTPTDNFAVMNPLAYSPSMTHSNGNLKLNGTLANWYGSPATIYVDSGKWYWETTITSRGTYSQVGLAEEDWLPNSSPGLQSNAYGYYSFNGNAVRDGTTTAYGATYTTGDVIGITLDYDNGEITYYKNGVSQGVAFTGVTEKLTPASALYGTATHNYNFGQLPFAYAVPTGFKALSTKNLPDATVVPSENFDVILGDGATIKDTAEAVYPTQLSWIKGLGVNNHQLIDSVRGLDSILQCNTTSTSTTYVTPVGNSVAWNWKAGTEVTNNEGAIATQVSANSEAGFSIVTWTKNGGSGARTIGHGLGGVPQIVFFKEVDDPSNWSTYIGVTGSTTRDYLYLNLVDAQGSDALQWDDTAPTSTEFTYNQTYSFGSGDSDTMLGYFFRSIEGYSKISTYTGNGNANGPFVYTGFRPAYVLAKRTNGEDGWYILDAARNTFNAVNSALFANASGAENTVTNRVDLLSNGFKLRTTSGPNQTGATYIYMAVAEQPFKNTNAR